MSKLAVDGDVEAMTEMLSNIDEESLQDAANEVLVKISKKALERTEVSGGHAISRIFRKKESTLDVRSTMTLLLSPLMMKFIFPITVTPSPPGP